MSAARRSPLFGYVAAILAVLLAAALRLAFDPFLGNAVPLAFFFVGVTAVAFYSTLGPALAATAASIIIGKYLFLPPRHTFGWRESDLVLALFFVLACTLVIALATRVNRARERMEIATARVDAQAAAVQLERTRLREMISSIPGVV